MPINYDPFNTSILIWIILNLILEIEYLDNAMAHKIFL